jgi:hypothetical protein
MSEDRQDPNAGRTEPRQPQPAGVPTDGRVDHNSRIETRLWQLHKGVDRAEARMCVKFARREFRVYVNGELLWSRNYGLEDTRQFDADAAAKHREMTGLGWETV